MLQILLLPAFLIPAIFFLLSQQRILRVIRPENREISPGSVWLQIIPAFGLIWQFFVVTRIARSVSRELSSRLGESILDHSQAQIKETDEFPTYSIGITYCTLNTIGFIINFSMRYTRSYLGLFGTLFVFTGMACWIIYWVRLVKTKNRLVLLSAEVDRQL